MNVLKQRLTTLLPCLAAALALVVAPARAGDCDSYYPQCGYNCTPAESIIVAEGCYSLGQLNCCKWVHYIDYCDQIDPNGPECEYTDSYSRLFLEGWVCCEGHSETVKKCRSPLNCASG